VSGVWKVWAVGSVSVVAMWRSRIDISQGLDGEPVVLACFDLGGEEIAASAHAVAATATERFRTATMSVDEVLEFRELTALADELADLAGRPGMRAVVLRPARLSAYRHAVARFVETRDDADWIREDDREPLARLRGLLVSLEELCAEALRAALSPRTAPRPC
jgi:hypothetical protein